MLCLTTRQLKYERKIEVTYKEAIGYMILAAKVLNIDKEVIEQIETEMQYQIETKTDEEAREAYKSYASFWI